MKFEALVFVLGRIRGAYLAVDGRSLGSSGKSETLAGNMAGGTPHAFRG